MPMEMTANGYQQGVAIKSRPDPDPRQLNVALTVDIDEDIECLHPVSEMIDTSLPILATGNDVREVVRFLKKKPFGVTVIEAMNAEPRRVFDARKIAAYEFWGILERGGERLKLSGLGQELAERIKPECDIYRRILRSIPTYLGALRSFYQQRLKIVTRLESANYWKDSHPELDLFKQDDKNVEAIAVSFFSVCHAAELGTMTIGKRGQPARLRIDLDELEDFFEGGDAAETPSLIPWPKPRPHRYSSALNSTSVTGRVYLAVRSDRSASAAIGRLQTVLELADFDEVVFQADAGSDFLPQTELAAIQQCEVAVFVVDAGDCISDKNGDWELRGSQFAKISVAMALLNYRVALLWDTRDGDPPKSLEQANLHVFDGENFDWNSGARLIGLLKSFRR